MPLEEGKSKKVVSKNIKETISSYKKTGRIGTSKPKSLKAAMAQAAAIAYRIKRGQGVNIRKHKKWFEEKAGSSPKDAKAQAMRFEKVRKGK